jgi:uncharacterized small protein (DUF1192 family)
MGHLLSVLLKNVCRNLLVFTSIVLILASVNWLRSEWKNMQSIVGELPSLQRSQKNLSEYQAALVQKIAQQIGQLSSATVQQFDARIRALDFEIHRLKQEQEKLSIPSMAVKVSESVPEQLEQAAKRQIQIELWQQERDYLIALRARVDALLNRQVAVKKLEQIRLAHVKAYTALQSAQKQQNMGALAKLLARVPFTKAKKEAEELAELWAKNDKAHKDFLVQQVLVNQLPRFTAPAAFQVYEQRLASAVAPLRDRLVRAENLAAENYVWRAFQIVRPLIPVALYILLGSWFVPAAIRALFYFVLAPAAARRLPFVIGMPDRIRFFSPSSGPCSGHDSSLISAVSKKITLAPGHEMLIRPDYCQSQAVGVNVTTKLLFNWHHWLPSIASHMWMLKHLRTTQAAEIVVSSTIDALEEVAFLEMASGEAFVLQSRGLVGVLYKTGQRPRIRSHWRLATLHAWLTLQLRYLSFEGPATLIVKGCRGVRLENASTGRTISQDATLGFSANTIYSTVRAEPFVPYLRGKQALLHDKFVGSNAYYLYEEIPRAGRPGQQSHNPFEALLDAGLKAFGI